jgi:hypothetical protein
MSEALDRLSFFPFVFILSTSPLPDLLPDTPVYNVIAHTLTS